MASLFEGFFKVFIRWFGLNRLGCRARFRQGGRKRRKRWSSLLRFEWRTARFRPFFARCPPFGGISI